MQPVHFFVGSTFMGNGQRDMLDHEPKRSPPLSTAFFCPKCGEVWARTVIPGQAYMVYALLCERHTLDWPWQVPGSIWLACEAQHNASLSREMLEREFAIHLAHYDRFKDQLT